MLALTEANHYQPQFIHETRISTPPDYKNWLQAIFNYAHETEATIDTISLGYPGRVNSKTGHLQRAENLSWHDQPLTQDLKQHFPQARILLENDANLGGLAEATSGAGKDYNSVYYLTISTGIGGGYITNGRINTLVGNSEPGHMLVSNNGHLVLWESVASGHAFAEIYNKQARDVPSDSDIWEDYVARLVPGIVNITALLNPKVLVIGGSMGEHFSNWESTLQRQLKAALPKFLNLPDIKAASHPGSAVLIGTFHYAKTNS